MENQNKVLFIALYSWSRRGIEKDILLFVANENCDKLEEFYRAYSAHNKVLGVDCGDIRESGVLPIFRQISSVFDFSAKEVDEYFVELIKN